MCLPSPLFHRYEGAGAYRRVRLISAPLSSSIATHGIAAPANVTGAITPVTPGSPAAGLRAPASVFPTVLLRNDGATPTMVTVNFTLLKADGSVAVSRATSMVTIPANGSLSASVPALPIAAAELWSVARPYLYSLVTAVIPMSGGVIDSVSSTIGVRAPTWDSDTGFYLNKEPVKMRGFCNHENFGAIGAAMPARVDLLRVQQLRGVGGNAWRTSHNAPEPSLLDITDRLGVLVMDENRVFATTQSCQGCSNVPVYAGDPVADMSDLVSRDKLHSSVIWWSFCVSSGLIFLIQSRAIAHDPIAYSTMSTHAFLLIPPAERGGVWRWPRHPR